MTRAVAMQERRVKKGISIGTGMLALVWLGIVPAAAQEVPAAERLQVEAAIPGAAFAKPLKPRKLLIFDLNVNYGGHGSIPTANLAFTLMGQKTGAFETVVSHDPKVFESESLRQFDAVFFNNTVGNCFEDPGLRQNLLEFVHGGGGLSQVKSVFTIWKKTEVPTIGDSYVPLEPALPGETPPAGLDWNLWVGPARYRPYNPAYHRNPMPGVVPWSFCEAFGAGAVTGYHSHAADVIQYAIGMETSGPVEIIHPVSGEFPTLTCRYANGVLLHHVDHWDQVKDLYHAVPGNARLAGLFDGLFVGERGWITSMSGAGPVEAGPVSLLDEMQLKTREVAIGSNNHHTNWIDCIRTRRQPAAHEEIGHRSAVLGHLVTTSFLLGRSLKWNPQLEEFAGDDAANRLRGRAMRAPWQI